MNFIDDCDDSNRNYCIIEEHDMEILEGLEGVEGVEGVEGRGGGRGNQDTSGCWCNLRQAVNPYV